MSNAKAEELICAAWSIACMECWQAGFRGAAFACAAAAVIAAICMAIAIVGSRH